MAEWVPSGCVMFTPAPPFDIALVADPSVYIWIHASLGYLSSMAASVSELLATSLWLSPGSTPGMEVWIESLEFVVFQGSFGWYESSGKTLSGSFSFCCLERNLLVWTKLFLFNLFWARFLSFFCIGWSWSALYFSPWIRSFVSRLLLRGCTPVVDSIAAMGVDFIAPVIILRAWFCTLSRVSLFVLDVEDQAEEAYSITGRTAP